MKVTSAERVATRVSVSCGAESWQANGSLCTSNRQTRAALPHVTFTSLSSDGSVSGKEVSGKVAGRCQHVLAADSEASVVVPDAGQARNQK